MLRGGGGGPPSAVRLEVRQAERPTDLCGQRTTRCESSEDKVKPHLLLDGGEVRALSGQLLTGFPPVKKTPQTSPVGAPGPPASQLGLGSKSRKQECRRRSLWRIHPDSVGCGEGTEGTGASGRCGRHSSRTAALCSRSLCIETRRPHSRAQAPAAWESCNSRNTLPRARLPTGSSRRPLAPAFCGLKPHFWCHLKCLCACSTP